MLQQTNNIVYMCLKSVQMFGKRVKVLAYNSCVSVSLVLLMEGVLKSSQRFGFE